MGKRALDTQPYSPFNEKLIETVVVPRHSAEVTRPPEPSIERHPEAHPPSREPSGPPVHLRLGPKKTVVLPVDENEEVERLLVGLSADLGTSVNFTDLVRSLLVISTNAQHEIRDRAKNLPRRIIRPPNGAYGDVRRFQQELAALVGEGIRRARPMSPR